MNSKVLFVAYHFPPDAAVGALRTQKFVKYLPEFGFETFVLTLKDRYYPLHDYSRMKDVNGAVVERTEFRRTPLQLLIDIRDNYFRNSRPTGSAIHRLDPTMQASKSTTKSSYIYRFLVSLNIFPDSNLYWVIPAFRRGMRLITDHNIKKIVVSAPPHSSLILAYLLASSAGASLVVDFRDPWVSQYKEDVWQFKPDILLLAERTVKRRILQYASAIITTNEFFKSALAKESPFLSSEKIRVVYNGFDTADYPTINQKAANRKYTISYLGSFYLKRSPENFLKALSQFMREKELDENHVEVRFIGYVENACGLPVEQMAKDTGLEKVVKMMGNVDYEQALKLMCDSDLLLLLAQGQPLQIPAKTYDYMGAKRPILALTGPGATRAVVEETHAGICVEPNDIRAINLALHTLYDDHRNGGRSYAINDVSHFERRAQAARLAEVLRRDNQDS